MPSRRWAPYADAIKLILTESESDSTANLSPEGYKFFQESIGNEISDACEEDDGFIILLPVIKQILDERAKTQ